MARKIEQALELWNILDERDVKAGRRRVLKVVAKVDNGSGYTVLPKTMADELRLLPLRTVWVRYADERRARRQVVQGLKIRVPGLRDREIVTEALVEPRCQTVLLGCEEMERMELIADHKAGTLRPRPGTERGITVEVE